MDRIFHVGRPNLGDLETFHDQLAGILDRKWFSNNGEVVQEFERKLEAFLEVKHCIAVCNATTGLQLVYQALELKGKVITSPFTFVATPHSILWEGLTPVFVDIDPETHNIDVASVANAIDDETSAIVGVHLWGRACSPESMVDLGEEANIPVIFDSAHAFGCKHQSKRIGNFGVCEVFSFHATKFIHTFEGGAITTNDDQLAEKLRLMRNFGFAGMDNVTALGINGKMSEVHAAMGLACLAQLEDILEINRSHYEQYRKNLSDINGISFFDYDDVEESNCQYVVIEIDREIAGISRDEVMMQLHEKGIRVRRYFFPGCHKMEPYSSLFPESADCFLNTDKVCEKIMVLPTGTAMTDEDVSFVCQEIRKAF